MSAAIPDWRRIAVVRDGGITDVTLHTDGESLVFDATVHREIVELVAWLRQDAQTRVVVLGGTGEDFCVSIDTPSFRDRGWHDIWTEGRLGPTGLLELDVPVIGVVNGPATYHSELVVTADVVLGCPETTFADHAHFTKGIVPGDGVQVVWPRLLGPSRGTYFLMTGQVLTAEESLRLGVLHEIHPRGRLRGRAHELARPWAALAPATLAYSRMALRGEDRRFFADPISHGLGLAGLEMFLTGKRTTNPTGEGLT
jgi:enoyl-CoA hydratase/carnithine racemase